MSDWYTTDTSRLTYAEYWDMAPGLGFVFAATAKLLGLPLGRPAFAFRHGILVLPPDKRPAHLLAGLRESLDLCAARGMPVELFYMRPTVGKTEAMACVFLADEGLTLAGAVHSRVENRGLVSRATVFHCTSCLPDGRFLVTSNRTRELRSPDGYDVVRLHGKAPGDVLATHTQRIAPQRARLLPFERGQFVDWLLEAERIGIEFQRARGVYVPVAADEVERLRAQFGSSEERLGLVGG